MLTITGEYQVTADRTVTLRLPQGIEPGLHQFVIVVEPGARPKRLRAGDLMTEGIAGFWSERTDLGDSLTFAENLRRQVERRRMGDSL